MYEHVHLGFGIDLRFRESARHGYCLIGSKVYPAQTTSRQLSAKLRYIYMYTFAFLFVYE